MPIREKERQCRLLVARAMPEGGRKTILNREFTVRRRDGVATRLLEGPDELVSVLGDEFDLHFDAGTRFPCPGLDWPEDGLRTS